MGTRFVAASVNLPGYQGLPRGETLTQGQQASLYSGEYAITATAAGTKANAFQLSQVINQISVCATNNDSVLLPASSPGMIVWIVNDGAATCQVYGKGTDTIDGVATATGVVLSNAKRAAFICTAPGKWSSMTGGPSA